MKKMILMAAVALCFVACGEKKTTEVEVAVADTVQVKKDAPVQDEPQQPEVEEPTAKFAPGYYKSTGDRVRVRTAPNLNSGIVQYTYDGYGNVYLDKGDCVKTKGEVENGFVKVYCCKAFWDEGWVAEQFLTPATKCKKCDGKGCLNKPCGDCGGEGCDFCCDYDGKEICVSCGGVGYK